MIRSMTGFGRSTQSENGYTLTAEVSSVNSRYLEVLTRLPRHLSLLESKAVETVQGLVSRGKVTVTISFELDAGGSQAVGGRVVADVSLARSYLHALRTLSDELGLDGEITLSSLIHQPDVLAVREPELDMEWLEGLLVSVLTQALAEYNEMRIRGR